MNKNKTFAAFLAKHQQWETQLLDMQKLLLECGLEETIKWGMPTYTFEGKNILGLGAFKEHIGVWFFQGVFLKDELGLLRNAQEGKTRGMRSWQIKKGEKIKVRAMKSYVKEAIANHKKGLAIKPERNKKLILPDELKTALKADKALKLKFEELTPGKRREFAEHIGTAKQEKTRLSRLEKSIPMILAGVGMNDKYKK